MSLFGRALAGIGEGAENIANKYIDEDLATQRAQAIADIQRTSSLQTMQATDAYNNSPERQAMLTANAVATQNALGTAKNATDLTGAINTATNPDLTAALAAREAAAAKAKADNTPFDLAPGQSRFGGTGAPIATNTHPTTADVQEKLYEQGLKGNAGAKSKADHFDDKDWDAAQKVDPSIVSFPDALGGKGTTSPELLTVYRTELQAARAAGSYSPSEASNQAMATTLKLKNAAQDMVDQAKAQDPKSPLTETKAVQTILQQFAAATKARQAAASRPAAAPVAAPATAPAMAPIAAPAPSLASQAAANPSMASMSAASLANLAGSPRSSPTMRAAAQAELDRRNSAAPGSTVDMNDPATDPRQFMQ